jgi:hypothetical protein
VIVFTAGLLAASTSSTVDLTTTSSPEEMDLIGANPRETANSSEAPCI